MTTEGLIEWDRAHEKKLFKKLFNWNDPEAAIQWRRIQARNFMEERFAYRMNGFRGRGWYNLQEDAESEGQVELPRADYPLPIVVDTSSLRQGVIDDIMRRIETQAATLKFLQLSAHEQAAVLARVERALSGETKPVLADSVNET